MTDSSLPRFLQDLVSWYAIESLALGHATGMREALVAGPGTAAEIASRAGTDLRATTDWLATMVAAGYATHAEGSFAVDDESVPFLTAQIPVTDTLAVLDFVLALGRRTEGIAAAARTGTPAPGLFGSEFATAVARVNAPLFGNALVSDWLAVVPAVADRMAAGVVVADVGCGDGSAVRVMAREFPASTFVGVERDPGALAAAEAQDCPENVSFAPDLPPHCDVITVIDAFHHFTDPRRSLDRWRACLPADGFLLIAEPGYQGSLDADSEDPTSVIGFACGFLYCNVEGRSNNPDSEPIAPQDGGAALVTALADAGFTSISSHDVAGGYRLHIAR